MRSEPMMHLLNDGGSTITSLLGGAAVLPMQLVAHRLGELVPEDFPARARRQRIEDAKATLIYRRTGDLRAVQLLLGVRYLGIEVDYALAIAKRVDV
jgi:hypothetical protein